MVDVSFLVSDTSRVVSTMLAVAIGYLTCRFTHPATLKARAARNRAAALRARLSPSFNDAIPPNIMRCTDLDIGKRCRFRAKHYGPHGSRTEGGNAYWWPNKEDPGTPPRKATKDVSTQAKDP